MKVEKAKRKLTMEWDEDSLHESKRVTRGSLRPNTVDEDFPVGSRIVDFKEIRKGLQKCSSGQQGASTRSKRRIKPVYDQDFVYDLPVNPLFSDKLLEPQLDTRSAPPSKERPAVSSSKTKASTSLLSANVIPTSTLTFDASTKDSTALRKQNDLSTGHKISSPA
ncbi:hypothetical protein ACROYT_G014602 [Oculina patagonica]